MSSKCQQCGHDWKSKHALSCSNVFKCYECHNYCCPDDNWTWFDSSIRIQFKLTKHQFERAVYLGLIECKRIRFSSEANQISLYNIESIGANIDKISLLPRTRDPGHRVNDEQVKMAREKLLAVKDLGLSYQLEVRRQLRAELDISAASLWSIENNTTHYDENYEKIRSRKANW